MGSIYNEEFIEKILCYQLNGRFTYDLPARNDRL